MPQASSTPTSPESSVPEPSSNHTAPPDQASGGKHSRHQVVGRLVAVVVTGLALYVVLPSLTRVLATWPQLATLSPVWLVGAFLAEAASFSCTFELQRLILRTKKRFAVAAAALTGNAVTNVLPAGDAAGATVQFRMLATAGINADTAVGGLAAASLLGIGGLLALPIFTLPAVLGGTQVSRGLVHTALLGLAGFALFIICGVIVMATDQPLARLGRIVQWVWNHIPGRHTKTAGLDRRFLSQRDQIRSTLGRDWTKAVVLTSGRLGFDFLCLLGCLRATGSAPRPSLVLLAYSAAGIVALVPLTPGGLGIVEASLSGLLVLAGVGAGNAFVATLAYRLASYWLPLVAGSIAYLLFRRHYGPIGQSGKKSISQK